MSPDLAAPTDRAPPRRAAPFLRLLAFALFLTFDLIMFGAFVRVTDAGLGCPDWPGCYGKASPIGAMSQIRQEAAALPDGPVTVFKAWVEMLHRYIAAGLGLIIIALVVLAHRDAQRRASVPLAWFTLFWILLQGAFGAWTVTLKLQPAIVTAHLLGGMVLFGLLVAQWVRVRAAFPGQSSSGPPALGRRDPAFVRRLAWGAALVLLVQIALGGWVSTNYATLACQDFPRCQGQWWPAADFARGFELWRPLGRSADGAALPFQALTAIHLSHRLWALVAFAVLGLLAARLWPTDRSRSRLLFSLLALQLATGLTNIFLDWPLAAAVLHTGGAAALLGVVLVVALRPPDLPR
jgi:cytochrome c oxidase assembly protein subunit 15